MSSWDELGPLYAKLGISTSADIIVARRTAAEAGFEAFKAAQLAGLLRATLGLGWSADADPLLAAMRGKDPTLDLQPTDREASLLLGTIGSAELDERSALGGLVALGLVVAGFGGTRSSPTMPDLARKADKTLAEMQLAGGGVGQKLPTTNKTPDDLTAALDAMSVFQTNWGPALNGTTGMAAIRKIAEIATAARTAAATQANAAIAHTRRLEEELRAYWWVVGAWSDDLRKPFAMIGLGEAALRAGRELAEKTTLPLGIFAAPALLDKVLRHDRKGRMTKVTIAGAVKGVEPAWRRQFAPTAAAHGDLLPVSLALHLSAESNDADDWKAKFKRIAQVEADTEATPLQLAVQLHREILLSRALPTPK